MNLYLNLQVNKNNRRFFKLNLLKQVASQISVDWSAYFNNNTCTNGINKMNKQAKNAVTYAMMRIIEGILLGNYFVCLYDIDMQPGNFRENKFTKRYRYLSFIIGRKAHRKRSIIMMIYWSIIWVFYAIKCFTNSDIKEKMKNNKIHDINSFIIFRDALSHLRISSKKSYKEYSELLLISTASGHRGHGLASTLLTEFEYDIGLENQINKQVSTPLVLFTTDYCDHDMYRKRKYFKLLEGGAPNQKQYVYVLEPNIYKRFEKENYKYRNEDKIDTALANYINKEKEFHESLEKLPKIMDVKKKAKAVEEIKMRLNYNFG
jgi:hypothetical protein